MFWNVEIAYVLKRPRPLTTEKNWVIVIIVNLRETVYIYSTPLNISNFSNGGLAC